MFTTTDSRPLIGRGPVIPLLIGCFLLSRTSRDGGACRQQDRRVAMATRATMAAAQGEWRQTVVAMVARWWQSLSTSAYLEILLCRLSGGSTGKGHKSHGRGRLSVLAGHF